MIKDINVKDLSKLLLQDKVILIDVREPDEFILGAIPGAVNIPLGHIAQDVVDKYKVEDKRLVFYCRLGKRSLRACELLSGDVFNLVGGIESWNELSDF